MAHSLRSVIALAVFGKLHTPDVYAVFPGNFLDSWQRAPYTGAITKSTNLQIAFENNGNYYKYCDKNKSWIPVGKCNMQIIIDEMSVKGKNIRLFNLDVYGI